MKTITIKKQYNQFHENYSKNLSEQNELSNSMFHEAIDIDLRGKKLLDIGCGDGRDLQMLSNRGAIVYGVDPSDAFIQKARSNNPNGILVNGVGEQLPFEDATFDVVISKWAIQTSYHVPEVLAETARVLKSNGTFVLLSKHPWMQWVEKVRDYGHGVDYYEQKVVTSNIYGGIIKLKEPTHTIGEYLNSDFFTNFELIDYQERTDFPASEQINGDIYPTFFIIKARRK